MTLEVYQPTQMVLKFHKFQHVSESRGGSLNWPTPTRVSEASSLGWRLAVYLSNMFPDAPDTAGLETTLWEPLP